MKRTALVITLVLAVVIFAGSFAGVSAALDATQPAVHGSTTTVQFVVQQGDSTAEVGQRLQSQGLIRNALVFKLLARLRNLDRGLKAGVYTLSYGMTMDQIIATLRDGQPGQQLTVTVPPGLRVLQYPALFAQFPSFNAQQFLQIATTGMYPSGSGEKVAAVWQKFWFVPQPGKNVTFALEGYLFPDTYDFYADSTASAVIDRLLAGFGEQLCPGPTAQPDAYLYTESQCKAHAVTVGTGTNLFTALEAKYFTSNDTLALYRALTIASIVMREVSKSHPDIIKVVDVYYNRYLVSLGKLPQPTDPGQPGGTDVVDFLGGDPTAQYARDTDSPPANGKYWQPLSAAASQVDPSNPYNTNNAVHKGLPPGPIAAPFWFTLGAAADPNASGATPYYFFLSSCGVEHYAATYTQFEQVISQYSNQSC